jgi:signal-transduction protein with cAMP-binding, CBS, and nucleotidyltransferase domain
MEKTMPDTKEFLKQVEMFIGLSETMLDDVAKLCQPAAYEADDLIIERSSPPSNAASGST